MRGTAVSDPFTRTLANGWGSTPPALSWSTIGVGGTVNASDWSVGGGLGVHSVPAALAYRASYLGAFSQSYVDIAVTGSVAVIASGGPIELANLMARGTDINTYYTFRAQIETSQAITALIFAPGGAQLGTITVPGITYTAGLQLRVRAQAVGKVLRMKVWKAALAEPVAWMLSVIDATYTGAGWIGVRSGVSGGNTNALPVVFSYDNFTSALLPDFPRDPMPLTVLVAWGADLSTDPSTWSWSDITDDVRAGTVNITDGRGDETSQAASASCSFQLLNDSSAYSAHNAMGPNYPFVRRNTPIWVLVDPSTEFFGYANGFTPSWDITGKQAVVSVSASGILRRLMQGKSPLRSPLYRAITARPELRAYWSMEDGAGSVSAASGIPGGQPMTVAGLTFASDSTEPGSAPLPKLGATTGAAAYVVANVSGSFSGHWQVDWYYRLPADPMPNRVKLMSVYTTDASGAAAGMRWDVSAGDGAFPTIMTVDAFNSAGTQVVASSSTVGTDLFGRWVHIYLTVQQSGANIQWRLAETPVDSYGLAATGTVAGTVGAPYLGTVPQDGNLNGLSMGHMSVLDAYNLHVADMAQSGFNGEPATIRLARLCAEQGIPIAITSGAETVFEAFEGPSLTLPFTGTWNFSTTQAHTGIRSFRSATITDSQQSDAVLDVVGATSMSLWYKVSSESGFDFFQILRDGVIESQFSGEVGWAQRTVSLVGVKKVTFRYVKDSSTSAGSDGAWIDDLTLTGPSATLMGTQSVDTIVNLLRECEAADGGLLYDGFGPGLGYIPKSARYNQPAALTLDMAADPPQVDDPFVPVDDDQRNRNQYTVSRKKGSSAIYEDVDGPLGTAAIGLYDSSATVNVSTDNVLPRYASWLVHLGTVEGLRYPSLNLDLAAVPALIDDWVAARLASRIDVLNVSGKATGHAPGTVSVLDEGYTQTLSPFGWKVAANCSPARPWEVFQIGDSRLGRVDTAGSKLAAGVTATATSLSVTTTREPRWITTAEYPAQFPFDATVDGVRVRVTAITGTGTTQTFTVTRSVDGADRALPINAVVRLWKPGVLAL